MQRKTGAEPCRSAKMLMEREMRAVRSLALTAGVSKWHPASLMLFDTLARGDQRSRQDVAPGAVWLKAWLTGEEQLALVARCRQILDGPAGAYVPTVRGGGKMHVRMSCLGRHWNAMTYQYGPTRADHDDAAVPPVPDDWARLAGRAAAEAGFEFVPDLCIVNAYGEDGRMGLHQDKDESAQSIEGGVPIVSVSLGDAARFQFGGFRRRDTVDTLRLESGDVFVFGGASRLRYHGVSRILPGTAPSGLGLTGRINLTFRKY